MSNIVLLVDFRVDDADAFRIAADKLIAIAQDEPGTLGYEWFASDDGRRVRIVERFADEAALATHSANIRPVIDELKAAGAMVGSEVLGEASDALRERMSGPTTTLFAPYAGIRR
jgi:quinol monooxygenase YgiN